MTSPPIDLIPPVGAALVVVGGLRLSSARAPRRLLPAPPPRPAPIATPSGGGEGRRGRLRVGLGPRRRRTLVAAVAAVATAVALVPPLAPLPVLAWWAAPRWRAVRGRRRATRSVVTTLPQAADLAVLAVDAGLPVVQVVAVVAGHAPGPVGAAFARVERAIARGAAPAEAVRSLTDDLGPPVRSLARVLARTAADGGSALGALERVAIEARADARRLAEQDARRIPVTMLFPLVLCTLPAFALLTVVPVLAGALGGLGP